METKIKKVELTLGAILRDVGNYIVDWIVHHHLVGFDRFVCVLHKTIDNSEEKLQWLKKELGIDIRVHHCRTEGQVQMGTYKWICKEYGPKTKWLLFLDGDEYVYHTNPSIEFESHIKEFLREFKKFSAVACHGKIFGPDHNLGIQESRYAYKMRLPLDSLSCRGIKTFFQPSKIEGVLSPHIQQVKGKSIRFDGKPFKLIDGWRTFEEPIFDPVCYDHYYTEGVKSWVDRFRRGSCNDPRPNHAYSSDEFFAHTGTIMEKDVVRFRYYWWHNAILRKLYHGDKLPEFSERITHLQ